MPTQQNIARRNDNVLNLLPVFAVVLHIDPDAPQAQDDKYRLFNEDGSLHQERTAKNDAKPGDGVLTLLFTGLVKGKKYSLDVDLGEEGRYFAFYKVTLEDLLETVADPNATVQNDNEESLPESFKDAEPDTDLPALKTSSMAPAEPAGEQQDGEPSSPLESAGRLIF